MLLIREWCMFRQVCGAQWVGGGGGGDAFTSGSVAVAASTLPVIWADRWHRITLKYRIQRQAIGCTLPVIWADWWHRITQLETSY